MWLSALAIAIGQYVLYRWLNGKAASNVDETVETTFCFLKTGPYTSQRYITTASVALANVFQWSLQLVLSLAFAQYLWKILRKSALRIEVIEAMFNVKANPLCIFSLDVIRYGWILVLMALVAWGLPAASSFTPGALTVKSVSPNIPGFATISTFNASDVSASFLLCSPVVKYTNVEVLAWEWHV